MLIAKLIEPGMGYGNICPAVCSHQTYITIILLGLIAGALLLGIFLLRKKIPSRLYKVLKIFLLIVFVLYSVEIESGGCGSGCDPDATYFDYQFSPSDYIPYVVGKKTKCEIGGGEWKTFSDTCTDRCGAAPQCGMTSTEDCDCGAGSCWNGTKCVTD